MILIVHVSMLGTSSPDVGAIGNVKLLQKVFRGFKCQPKGIKIIHLGTMNVCTNWYVNLSDSIYYSIYFSYYNLEQMGGQSRPMKLKPSPFTMGKM